MSLGAATGVKCSPSLNFGFGDRASRELLFEGAGFRAHLEIGRRFKLETGNRGVIVQGRGGSEASQATVGSLRDRRGDVAVTTARKRRRDCQNA